MITMRKQNALHKDKCGDLVTFTEQSLNGKLHFLCSNSFLRFLQEILFRKKIFFKPKIELTFTNATKSNISPV